VLQRSARTWRALLGVLAASVALSAAGVPRAADASSGTGSITSRGAAASAAYAADSTTQLAVAVPSGAQAGDVLIAALGFGRSNATSQPALSAPPGWTLASRTNQGNLSALAVFSHVFASGETAYTWTTTVAVGGTVLVAAYAGVDATNPVDVSKGQAATKKTSAVTAPSVTTTGPNDMLVAAYVGYKGSGGATTWSPPTGMTEVGDVNNGGARSGSLDNAVQAAKGASGTKTATASAAQDSAVGALTALRPSPDTTPPVVSGVGAGSVSASGATVSWTTDETSDSQVDYGLSSAYGSSSALNATLVLSHSVTLSGLAASTTYHYLVKSRDAAGNLALSADFTFTTSAPPDTTPPVISGVTAGSITTSGASVSWTTDEASDSQVDYGLTSTYGSSTPLDSTLVVAHSVSLTGLTAGTTYHYHVKSRDAAGNLATSSDFMFTTVLPPDTTPPVISGVTAGSVTVSGATVSWTTDEASDTQVDYGLASTYGSSTALDSTLVLAHSASLTGLSAGTTYHYHVKSRDAAGNLATSTDFTFTTSAPPDTTPPVISGVAAGSVTMSGATVSWTTDEASDSDVDFGTTTAYGSSTPLDSSLVIAHGVALSGLFASTTYHYRVSSRDAAGNLATSGDFTFTTTAVPDTTPPVISGVGAGSITASGATLSWATDEASDSEVDYGTTTAYGSSTPLDSSLVLSHSVTLSGLTASTTYHYRVNSHDAAGNLATSGDFTFTTPAPPDTTPPVISGVAAGSVTASGATVSWSTDEASNSEVDYGTTTAYGASTPLDSSLVLSHSVTLSGLTASTTYHYRVNSHDAAGNVATSADLTFTTAPPPDTTPPAISAVAMGSITASAATVSWTTDEASSSQVDYGATPAYGASTPFDSSLVLSHAVALSGLAAGTTYHYRVKSQDAAGNLATSPDFNFTTNAATSGAVPIIVDTDIYSDADDVGGLAIAFGLQLKGEATVVAIGVNTRTSRPAVATNSWKCVAAIAQFYGSPNVPIGSDMPDTGADPTQFNFIGPCAQLASASTPAPDTALNVYRRALAAAPNGSVVMIAIGYEENLSTLLNSSPDSISPLSGRDLVSQKVRTLVIMGGGYPSYGGENNLVGNPVAAQNVSSSWPTKIAWSGIEVGNAVHTGQTVSSVHPASSPVRAAYEAFVGPNNWIYSYDLTAVYHAVRPADTLLTEVGRGTNVIDSAGGNVFTLGAGNQYYLSVTDATSLDSAIEALLDTLPAPPPDTTPPVISAVSAGSLLSGAATVTWTTDEVSDSQVEYGVTSSYGSSSLLNTQLVVSHSVTLSGLTAATTYHYRVKSRDAAGNLAASADFTFLTASASAPGPNDSFDSNTIDPARWTVVQNGSTVAAANQELEITHPATTTWTKGTLQCSVAYDQTGKSVQLQVKRAANNGLGGATYGETSIFLSLDSTHYVYFFIAGGALTAWYNKGSGEVNLTPNWPAYSATAMQWLRFRESGGTLYWEYASGATAPGTWTTLASMPDPFPMTAVTFKIAAGSNVATTDVARFDNISTY